jgi:hypothetical protein
LPNLARWKSCERLWYPEEIISTDFSTDGRHSVQGLAPSNYMAFPDELGVLAGWRFLLPEQVLSGLSDGVPSRAAAGCRLQWDSSRWPNFASMLD